VYRIIKSIMVSCMEMIKFGLPKFNHSTRIVIEPRDALIDDLRIRERQVFKALITDKARGLFNAS